MRVIGGTSRGRRLAGPRGLDVRPTADHVKEALFNILADRMAGARFLDLFAGTGNIGIEALSREARQATFVESSPAVSRLLRANLQRCGFERQADVRVMPVSRFLKHWREPAYDIVFLDPPYQTQEAEKVLPSLGRDAIIRPNGVVVVEHFHKSPLDDRIGHLALVKTYRYGDTCLSVYRSVREETPA
ncbi:MAG: 16S rRNA (guanine(966)-N(2))-methyltransferase RsmD [Nitrospirota bacterium]